MSKPFKWDGSFHDLCPNCDGTAPPHVECICGLLAEAEHRGMAQGQKALELLREMAIDENFYNCVGQYRRRARKIVGLAT